MHMSPHTNRKIHAYEARYDMTKSLHYYSLTTPEMT
jgi:hypothetical protein